MASLMQFPPRDGREQDNLTTKSTINTKIIITARAGIQIFFYACFAPLLYVEVVAGCINFPAVRGSWATGTKSYNRAKMPRPQSNLF